jgi:hypothetical protein
MKINKNIIVEPLFYSYEKDGTFIFIDRRLGMLYLFLNVVMQV